MSMKELLKVKLNKVSKGERVQLVSDNLSELVSFYLKKGFREKDIVTEIFVKMTDLKFAKALKAALKEDEDAAEPGIVVLLYSFLERNHDKVEKDVSDIYHGIINSLLKKKIKKFSKKISVSDDSIAFAKELLVIVPDKSIVENVRIVGIFVQRIIRKLYAISSDKSLKLDNKILSKVFKELFEEDLMDTIIIDIALERKDTLNSISRNSNQMEVWNALTNFVLSYLEDMKKKKIKERLEYYIKRREYDDKNNRDNNRRIQFTQISEDTYPKICSVVQDMKNKKYL